MAKVFVSHSTLDESIAEKFVDLILEQGIGISEDDIFCVSSKGRGVRSGSNWRSDIQLRLEEAEIVFLLISVNYKASEMSQYELGAAWVLGKKITPLMVPPISIETVGPIAKEYQCKSLINDDNLDEIHDDIHKMDSISTAHPSVSKWNNKKAEFTRVVSEYIRTQTFQIIENIKPYRKYHNDLSKVDTQENLNLSRLISKQTILLVVGCHMYSELVGRPAAEYLREIIDNRGDHSNRQRAIMIGDRQWFVDFNGEPNMKYEQAGSQIYDKQRQNCVISLGSTLMNWLNYLIEKNLDKRLIKKGDGFSIYYLSHNSAFIAIINNTPEGLLEGVKEYISLSKNGLSQLLEDVWV